MGEYDPIAYADALIARSREPAPEPAPVNLDNLSAAERAGYVAELESEVAKERKVSDARRTAETAAEIDRRHKASGRQGPPGKV